MYVTPTLSFRRTAAISSAIAAAALTAGLQAIQTPAPPDNSGTLSGRVVEAGTRRPIDDVQISVSAANVKPPTPVRTNAAGRFTFANLPSGSWQIAAVATGHYGSPLTVVLSPGARTADVEFTLKPYAAIAGIVRDDTGAPGARAQVRLYYRRGVGLNWLPGATASTDDQGRYRFSTVIAGEYVVSVPSVQTSMPLALSSALTDPAIRARVQSDVGSGALDARPGARGAFAQHDDLITTDRAPRPPVWLADGTVRVYPTHFHPSAHTLSEAVSLVVAAGDERTGVDIALRSVPAAAVAGTVIAPTVDGILPPFAISLHPAMPGADATAFPVASTLSGLDGRFRLPAVPLGTYTLRVYKAPTQPEGAQPAPVVLTPAQPGARTTAARPDPTARAFFVHREVAVTGAGQGDLVVTLRPGMAISGRAVFDGTAAPPDEAAMSAIRITAVSYDGRVTPYRPAALGADGRFEITGLEPGQYVLRSSVPSAPWRLLDARVGATDHTALPLVVDAADVRDVVLHFTDRMPEVSGRVRDRSGSPVAGAYVLIFPQPRHLRLEPGPPRVVRAVRAASDGSFAATALPPGDYFAAVTREDVGVGWNAPGVVWNTPENLQRAEGRAIRFSLALGERRVLNLTAPDDGQAPAAPSVSRTLPALVSENTAEGIESSPIDAIEPVWAARLSGLVVTRHDEPLSGAAVVARRLDGPSPDASTWTDAAGRFVFPDLPPGRYVISGRRNGYVPIEYGAARMRQPGLPITVRADEPVEIRLVLPRAATVSGTVREESGRPLPAMTVQLLELRHRFGIEALRPAGEVESGDVRTDDGGRFRLYGVPPGEYLVGVTPPARLRLASAPTPAVGTTSRPAAPTALAAAFFPGVPAAAGARRLTVSEGDELDAVDIHVPRVQTASFVGVTVSLAGTPVVAEVTMFPAEAYIPATSVPDGPGMAMSLGGYARVTTRADGTFSVSGLTAGRYRLLARSVARDGAGELAWAMRNVEVSPDHAAVERIVVTRGTRIDGRILIDSDPAQPWTARLAPTLLLADDAGGALSFPRLAVDRQGAFTFQGVPSGRYWPVVEGLPAGVAIERVLFNGTDATAAPIEISGEVTSTLVLLASARSGTLVGRVLVDGDVGASAYLVALIPADRRYWNPTMARAALVRPDAAGAYEFSDIPEGRYRLAVASDVSPADLEHLPVLDALAAAGVDVEIAANVVRRQDVRVARQWHPSRSLGKRRWRG